MNVSVSKLRAHPAQMRTVTNVMALAQLALQMRKPDPNLPLLVLPVEDEFMVISGHRRWLAAMIARLTEEPTVEAMVITIEKVCHPQNSLIRLDEELYKELLALLPADFELPAAEWSDEEGKEILGLLRANMGAEEPDLLGQSFCLTQAVAQGYTIEELAQAAGLPVAKAQAIMDIGFLQATYQEMLQDGRLHLEIVPKLMALNTNARVGLQRALKAYDQELDDDERARANYTNNVALSIFFMEADVTIFDRKDASPEEVNRRLVIRSLCALAKEKTAKSYYEALAGYVLRGMTSPITATDAYRKTLAVLPASEQYFYDDWRVMLKDDALKILEDASCNTCQFAGLPQDAYLKVELNITCRKDKHLPDDQHRCWSWAPQGESFSYRIPYGWNDGGKEVNSIEMLLKAWQGQKKLEKAKSSPMALEEEEGMDEDASAMGLQRAAIRFFMERHVQSPFTVAHPWATTCEHCKYHLQRSPVKSDPDAPHCQWSRGRQRLVFEARVPEEDEAEETLPWIPFCHQYAPQEGWASIIPPAESGGPFPRDVMMALVLKLADSTNSQTYDVTSHGVVQFLTGRPESASGNHRYTFEQWYKLQVEDLSDAQLYTLFQWVSCYWLARQSRSNVILIPYDGLLVSCAHHRFDVALRQEQKELDEEGDDLG